MYVVKMISFVCCPEQSGHFIKGKYMQVNYIVTPFYVYDGKVLAGLKAEFSTIQKAVKYAKTMQCHEYCIETRVLQDRKITRSPPIFDFKKLFEGE